MELGRFMGSLHPVLIHFPLVLLLVAVLVEALAFFTKNERLSRVGSGLLLCGTVSTLFAFVCGNFAELWAARSGISQAALENHEFFATVTSWTFVGLTAWRMLLSPTTANRRVRGVWLILAVGACILLGVTGHRGGSLVYEQGAGVQNLALQRIPPHDDLYQLTQKQDQESIFYSNMMHHIFGWMVLVLSGLLLLDLISPKVGTVARRFGPLLLFAGGLFLLIFSDQDSWPLYHVRPFRPITDKEVLLHKTYAVLMLLIGARGLWTLWRGRGRSEVAQNLRIHDRLMAVFALVGGALLFTHIHSAAPYANVAVGVYIHHTALGLIALSIGAVKLFDDALARRYKEAAVTHLRRSLTLRRIAYPALMCVEAILLINYNEGLPWFLGYQDQSVAAPHGGLLAPLGRNRAELLFSPETGRLEVYVLNPQRGEPAALPAEEAAAIVRVGEEATLVPLTAAEGETGSHYVGSVGFLKETPLFQAQAIFAVGGRRLTADFEPWVAPRYAAVSVAAAYVCPMHPEVGAESPGLCPQCGMPLEARYRTRKADSLHDPEYTLDFQTSPAAPGTRMHLTFAPHREGDGAAPLPLARVHTKPLHLIVVRKDLSFFDHVHPESQMDGSLALDYTFPQAGDYLLYADLTPQNATNQVFRLPVTVPGNAPPSLALQETPASARLIGDYRISLSVSPTPAASRDESTLTFTLTQDGKPLADLEPFLGAGGHCVILSEDTKAYLHSHPVERAPAAVYGPSVTFHTHFPRPGLYKVWGQFQRQGRVLTADFVLRVR